MIIKILLLCIKLIIVLCTFESNRSLKEANDVLSNMVAFYNNDDLHYADDLNLPLQKFEILKPQTRANSIINFD